jgi:fatty-acyl-CoA synthase
MYSMPEINALSVMVSDEEYLARQNTLSPHDVVNMQYTSGTTGFPKGVMLTHHNIGNNGYFVGGNQQFTEKDRLCVPVPLFHCFGCVMGVIGTVSHGSCMVILEGFDPLMVMTSIEKERCTALYGVPTMFIALLDHPMFSKFDFSSLRTGIMAGSNCPVKVMENVIDKMNMSDVTICYGLTETSPVMTYTRIGDEFRLRVETVGRALPHLEVKVIEPNTGVTLPPGSQGEVCCRGYSVMKGYYNNDKATREAITEDGWLRSGDLGIMDEDGNLSITGRIKDMIIRGGENIYPREIEEFLYNMDGVKDVQVAAVPSNKYGEEVGAFIVRRENAKIEASDVVDFCRGKIARFKVPKYVHFVDGYPMTASGKIQKYKLSEMSKEIWPERI